MSCDNCDQSDTIYSCGATCLGHLSISDVGYKRAEDFPNEQKSHRNRKFCIDDNVDLSRSVLSRFYSILQFKSERNKVKSFRCFGFYLTMLLFILSSGGAIIVCGTNWFDNTLQRIITIRNGTFVYRIWRDTKLDMNAYVYPFNYTNVDAILAGKEKPVVKELGPYVFRHEMGKWNISFKGTDKVTYSENLTNTFLEELSVGSLDDVVYTPNVILISVIRKLRDLNMFAQISASAFIKSLKVEPFLKLSVRQLLFGFEGGTEILQDLLVLVHQERPPNLGLLANTNGLLYDRMTIGTGIPDLNKIGILQEINGKTNFSEVNKDECRNLTEGDGFIFPAQMVASHETLAFYRRLLCFSLPLEYTGDVVTPQGYPANRYALPKDFYDSGDINPLNKCYCEEKCHRSGILDIARCYYGAPAFISNPHFLYGDKAYLEDVEGLSPDPKKHLFYFDVHKTGLSVGGKVSWQLGLYVKKARYVTTLKGLKEGIALPIGWASLESRNLTGVPESLMNHLTCTAPLVKRTLQYTSVILSLVFLLRLLAYLCNIPFINNIFTIKYIS